MHSRFPDSSMFSAGEPHGDHPELPRRGPPLPMLFALLICGLVVLMFAIDQALAADATRRFDPAGLTQAAEQLLQSESAALGEVHVAVHPADPRLDLPACTALEAFLPPGARAQGHTTVGVRCTAPSAWTVYLQAQVQILAPYLAALRPLAPGQLLGAGDLVLRTGDINELGSHYLTDPAQAIGHTLTTALHAGQAVHGEYLKVIPAVQSGQNVQLLVQGKGFQVSGEGTAIGNAGEGQTVQVRTPRGNLVSGIARAGGVVELHL